MIRGIDDPKCVLDRIDTLALRAQGRGCDAEKDGKNERGRPARATHVGRDATTALCWPRVARFGYCTFAVTVDELFNVNVQVFLLLPPLEQAPDQIASRPFDTLSVMLVPDANDAAPLLPVLTLMPDRRRRDALTVAARGGDGQRRVLRRRWRWCQRAASR